MRDICSLCQKWRFPQYLTYKERFLRENGKVLWILNLKLSSFFFENFSIFFLQKILKFRPISYIFLWNYFKKYSIFLWNLLKKSWKKSSKFLKNLQNFFKKSSLNFSKKFFKQFLCAENQYFFLQKVSMRENLKSVNFWLKSFTVFCFMFYSGFFLKHVSFNFLHL